MTRLQEKHIKLCFERDRARTWAALWKRAAKFYRKSYDSLEDYSDEQDREIVALMQSLATASDALHEARRRERLLQMALDDERMYWEPQVQQLHKALLAVEWVLDDVDNPYCPWCEKYDTHADDCQREAALAITEEKK